MRRKFPGRQMYALSVLIVFILFIMVLIWMNKLTLGDFRKRLMQ
jgi:hypothetical protein